MPQSEKFKKLMEPGQIGTVHTRNRIIKTGASMCYWHENDLHMSEKAKAYYEALAKGGVGLLIVESPDFDYPLGTRWRERYRMDDDKYIQGMSELTAVIHNHGCPTFMQMWHDGPWQSPLFPDKPATFDGPPIGASAVNIKTMGDFNNDIPRVLTIPEIEAITEKWISAAVRARKAGFDGIDINAGSSHLMHNFLSPFWNRREDEYGGTLQNRTRFLANIISGIKQRAGKDFPVSVLINAIEVGRAFGIDDNQCMTPEYSRQVAVILQEAGADALQTRNQWLGYHAGGFMTDYLFYPEPPLDLKDFPPEYNCRDRGAGANLYLARGMKKVLSIPVIIVGKINMELGEKILREGSADFIGMTRALQADPQMPNKLAGGRLEDIAPCTACATCLDQSISMTRRCRINAAMGTLQYEVEKAEKRKKVVVAGGGPAGMEAARVAALRGHEVSLYEKTGRLGGLIPLASMVKGTELENLPDLVRYLKTQIHKLGVKVELGKEVTASMIEQLKPDAVIVATGGTLNIPQVNGINKPAVITTPALHRRVKPFLGCPGPRFLGWLTRFWLPLGKNVAVIGGELHGCEVAEFLVKRGRKVTILEKSDIIGKGVLDLRLALLLNWFEKKGVTILTGVKSMEITDTGVTIVNKQGEKQTLEADSIVPTMPMSPNTALLDSLKGKAPEIYAIGDCKEPRMIVDAIADGWRIANSI